MASGSIWNKTGLHATSLSERPSPSRTSGDLKTSSRRAPWREAPFWALVLVASAIYFTRLDLLSVRGEESRWASVAQAMRETGDWICPRQQGNPFLSRPPLQSWLIAGASSLRGEYDAVAIRWPSSLASLLSVLAVYCYARRSQSALGAWTSALALATAPQVLQLGRLGETDSLFTCLLSCGLLFAGRATTARGAAWGAWLGMGICIGLATLAKGLQAPVYAAAAVGVFYVVERQWRRLFAPGPWLALGVACLVVSAWLVPFWQQLGPAAVREIFLGDVAMRYADRSAATFFKHAATYPLEIIWCWFPWSILGAAYFWRGFRQRLSLTGEQKFLLVALAVTFPTCWLTPGARTRYFLPMYPLVAPWIGVVVEQWVWAAERAGWKKLWPAVVRLICATSGIAGASVLAGACWWALQGSTSAAAGAFAGSVAIWSVAWTLADSLRRAKRSAVWRGTFGVAAALVSLVAGLGTAFLVYRTEPIEANVRKLTAKMPRDAKLVSFGPAHHLFTYHFGRPIARRDWPQPGSALLEPGEYFCFENSDDFRPQPLPFAWEEVAVISCEKNRQRQPRMKMVIGRRLGEVRVAQRDQGVARDGRKPSGCREVRSRWGFTSSAQTDRRLRPDRALL